MAYKCRRCKVSLVKRTNKHNGLEFYGCPKFPRCKYTKDIYGKDKEDRRLERERNPRRRYYDNPDIIGSGCQADYGMWGSGENDQGPGF